MAAEYRSDPNHVRWGVLGTANIAARAFLPALRSAGGVASVVGSRDRDRGTGWARAHGVTTAGSYRDAIDSEAVDAIYIALPNDQHVEWTARAAATGKAVLCEKPLGLTAAEVAGLAAIDNPLVWESFVFPFHPQTTQLLALLAEAVIGEWREVHSEFHFRLTDPSNLRFSAAHGGGALFDVGCYPIRLARLLFGTEPDRAQVSASRDGHEVDVAVAGVLDFPDDRRLLFSAGFGRPASTFTRIIGTDGELRLSNPFHPGGADAIELWRQGERLERWAAPQGTAFEHAIRHVHDVARGRQAPRHTVTDDALGQARALELARAAAAVVR